MFRRWLRSQLHGWGHIARHRPASRLLPFATATSTMGCHHESNEAGVAGPAALLLVAGPHDLDAGNWPKPPKLPLEHLLIHVRRQVANIPAG